MPESRTGARIQRNQVLETVVKRGGGAVGFRSAPQMAPVVSLRNSLALLEKRLLERFEDLSSVPATSRITPGLLSAVSVSTYDRQGTLRSTVWINSEACGPRNATLDTAARTFGQTEAIPPG